MTLAPRHRQVLIFLAEGATRAAIADEMGLSINTVNGYVREIFSILQCHNALEAVWIFYYGAPQLKSTPLAARVTH